MSAADELKALGPKKAIVDGDEVQSHSIPDLIAWDKYSRKRADHKNPFLKCYRTKFVIPAAVSDMPPPSCLDLPVRGSCNCPG